MAQPIYLDNNATTAADPRVVAEMLPLFQTNYGNPASKTHAFGWHAEETIKIARERVARLIDAEPDEIIFTSGATESNNLALFGAAGAPGSRVLSDAIEHRSVLDTLEQLSTRGYEVILSDVSRDGLINPNAFSALLSPRTSLVSLMLGNNEIGTIFDLPALVSACRSESPQALIHCDAAQAAGKVPLSVKKLDCDLLSLSGHKIYGPKGVGAVWIKAAALGRVKPYMFGGGHERGLRSGTLNVPAIAGMGLACELAQAALADEPARLLALRRRFVDKLEEGIGEVRINGTTERRLPGNLNLRIPGVESGQLLSRIATKVALSASSACTSGRPGGSFVLRALGLSPTEVAESIRVGIGRFNTEDEIDRAAEIIAEVIREKRERS